MDRRAFLGAVAATSLAASAPLQAQSPIRRRNRLKQGLWRIAFGDDTRLSFDEQCREAARLGAHGFDLINPEDWPTMRKHGLRPTLAPTGGVDFPNGLIHPEVHDRIEASVRAHIDLCARNDVRTFISVGGQRRGMPFDQAMDNAARFLNRIKGQLEERNVTLAIENMNNRRTDPRYGREDQVFGHWDWGIALCERVNSPNVKIVCDIYHLQIMDPAAIRSTLLRS
jgi:hydroxypyruvate isomerase